MRSYLEIRYSFVCPKVQCAHQFEQRLSELLKVDNVSCPRCRTTIDITESKRTGDLSQIFRDLKNLEQSRSEA
jgi:hypothetical protein